jgi:Flp pilus assembly protein TadG
MLMNSSPEPIGVISACRNDERGAVAVIFALTLTVVLAAGGIALDMARLSSTRGKLQEAVDAATLAGARSFARTQNPDTAIQAAQSFFEQTKSSNSALSSVTLVDPKIDEMRMEFTASSETLLPTTLSAVLGMSDFKVAVKSASALVADNIEVSIMIDLSSSMTGQRFTDAKIALRQFVNGVMINEKAQKPLKIAFAPFSSAVNPGSYYTAAAGVSGAQPACVGERAGATQYTDDAPGPGAYFNQFTPAPDWPCLESTVMPLEQKKDTVLKRIDDLKLSEGTAGHLGTMWSWYLISPKWASIWPSGSTPAAYGTTNKVVILMTDGENFPKDLPTDEAADNYALQVCTNMKAAGVTVYSIGFHVDVARAERLLKACASSSDKHYFPFGSDQLSATYRSIANSLTQLRLVQ